MSILSFHEVSKHYTGLDTALKKVSFQLNEGEFTALAGPSGSGKTTILNLAAGLDKANSGSICLLEKDLGSLSSNETAAIRRNNVGFIFQSYNLFPVLTALENIEYPLALNHVEKKERRERAIEALAVVGLEKFIKRFPNELSGGQQQRVAIARAIANQPKIIFADEPTANVDSPTANRIIQLFQLLNEQKKITFLFSSHDSKVLEKASRLIHVADGSIQCAEK